MNKYICLLVLIAFNTIRGTAQHTDVSALLGKWYLISAVEEDTLLLSRDYNDASYVEWNFKNADTLVICSGNLNLPLKQPENYNLTADYEKFSWTLHPYEDKPDELIIANKNGVLTYSLLQTGVKKACWVMQSNRRYSKTPAQKRNSKTYYFVSRPADSTVFDQDTLRLTTLRQDDLASRFRFNNDSVFIYSYNVKVDTFRVMDKNTGHIVTVVTEGGDDIEGRWEPEDADGYLRIILPDTIYRYAVLKEDESLTFIRK